MSEFISFKIEDYDAFKKKLVCWANTFPIFSFLDSNKYPDIYSKYDYIIGIDSVSSVHSLNELTPNKFQFGFITYEYNQSRFELKDNQTSFIHFDPCFFFEPRYVLYCKDSRIYINRNAIEALHILDIIDQVKPDEYAIPKIKLNPRISKSEYIHTINQIQENIQNGQYYELNYCIEFYKESTEIHPIYTFLQINAIAQSPMSALFKYNDKWILSFSPERLAALRGQKLICQPIKGTARRNLMDKDVDEMIKLELENSTKERAENIMVVDLMRNDMTPYAQTGSIEVKELCKIYTFPFVHQMISTIEATLLPQYNPIKIIENLIPAGSMTGAPKKEVMKSIKKLENFKRGIYSGNIGYLDADGDFDFNVVIRTLQYDANKKKIVLNVGGAITILSDAEKEYHECLLKAEGILKFFQ